MLQDLGSDHQPILLTVPVFPVFRPNEYLPSFIFQKARWYNFAFYFDSYSLSAEKYSSLFLSSAAALFTSLTPNALLTIWCSGKTALFLFLLAKAALAYLPTALFMALRPPYSFQQTQYVQVFPRKPAPFCTLLAGLRTTNKSATSLLFSYLTLALSSPTCPLLHLSVYFYLSGRCGRNCFLSPSVLSGVNGSRDTRFPQGTTRLISWPDGECYSCQQQSLTVSLLLSLVSTLLFSRTGGILSHRNSLPLRFPQFPPRNLCSLVTLAVFSLVYTATDTALC